MLNRYQHNIIIPRENTSGDGLIVIINGQQIWGIKSIDVRAQSVLTFERTKEGNIKVDKKTGDLVETWKKVEHLQAKRASDKKIMVEW